MSGRMHVGFFERDEAVLAAARECRERGIEVVDLLSPYPLHGADEALGLRRSRMGWVTLAGGTAGLLGGFALEYWTAGVDWPLDVGGKPLNSLPAFVPVAFELTILIAGLATAAALFARTRLWPGKRPAPDLERVTDDRHALILRRADARFEEGAFGELLRRHGAVEERELQEDER